MHNAISDHHLTKTQPVPEQQLPTSFAPVLTLSMTHCGMSLWPLGVGCPCCVSSQLPVPPTTLQVEWGEKLKSLGELV